MNIEAGKESRAKKWLLMLSVSACAWIPTHVLANDDDQHELLACDDSMKTGFNFRAML